MLVLQNFIDGVWRDANSGKTLENFNPATGSVYGSIPDSDGSDVADAVNAARNAQANWALTTAEQKFLILNKIAEGIDAKREELALAESMDQGKPLWLARNEMIRSAQNFRFYATAAMQFASESHSMEGKAINYTLRSPIGVVGCISPWNLPLYLFSWKIAPALAAGNCVIAKPSEFTSVTAWMLSKICAEAGLPKGVLNIVFGLGGSVGAAMVEHPKVKAISFTGGTVTGRHIASVAAPMFKKLSLELGGKNPNIIFDDCDFKKAIQTTVNSSFMNQGEICLCGSRVFVQRGIYQQFKERLVAEVQKLTVGNPLQEGVRVGAIVSEPHYKKVLGYLSLAAEEGGVFLTGGKALHPEGLEGGWYIEPTIIEGLTMAHRCNTEEIFGPVISIMPFDTEEEVIALANATDYGLAATVWTTNLTKAHRVADALESGIVWVNCWLLRDLRTPFGGVKNSGVGREGGWEAMRFFTEPKNVCISMQ
jgi:aminomuconate-semialdehyde/2-hydroxymuconate-6-semialdehyde dehydrogenase